MADLDTGRDVSVGWVVCGSDAAGVRGLASGWGLSTTSTRVDCTAQLLFGSAGGLFAGAFWLVREPPGGQSCIWCLSQDQYAADFVLRRRKMGRAQRVFMGQV